MSFEVPGAAALDEQPCRYGASKLLCRGPLRDLDQPYLAFLGGSETYGKFVGRPFVELVEAQLGRSCVNLGCVNAGLDAFVHDPEILSIAGRADLSVVQIPGAQDLSNRFYRVHPRRNDRFLAASVRLASIFHEVDFTEFHFNKHMLGTLYRLSPERFDIVRDELRQAWTARMKLLLRLLGKKPLLLWLRYQNSPKETGARALGADPLLVEREMIESLRPDVVDILEIPVIPAARSGDMQDMLFGAMQAPAAGHMIGPGAHHMIAGRLQAALGSAV